jgi:hypothetical protein
VFLLAALFATRHAVSVFQPTAPGFLWIGSDTQPEYDDVASKQPLSNTMPSGLRTLLDDLNDLWERAMIMRLWILEYQTTSWAKDHAMTGAEADLFEARFHVANAEVFAAALNQENRAKLELKRAENYLIETRPLIETRVRAGLEIIKNEITAVKVNPESARSENPEPYERIKSDLDRLIENLRITHA